MRLEISKGGVDGVGVIMYGGGIGQLCIVKVLDENCCDSNYNTNKDTIM